MFDYLEVLLDYFKRYKFLYNYGLIPSAVCAFICAIISTIIVKKIAVFFNIVDIPNARKIHTKPIPLLGGIAIFSGFIISLLFYNYKYGALIIFDFKFIIILATAVFMLIIGIIDDIKHLKPLTKLICQIIAAIIVVFIAGVKIDFFRYNIINLIITICWIVIITNSFNLLDNMDGLSAGIAAISLFLFFIIAITQNEYNNALICLLLSFSAAGFLLFNYNPASIFMGDGGSLFLGFFVSVIAINNSYLKFSLLTRLPILIPVLVLFIPLYDTLSVIFIRRKLGISIFKADKRHFSHRLVNLGLSQRAAVLIIYLATLSTGITATLLTKLTLIDAIIIILHTFMVFGIIAILEWYSFKKNDNNI